MHTRRLQHFIIVTVIVPLEHDSVSHLEMAGKRLRRRPFPMVSAPSLLSRPLINIVVPQPRRSSRHVLNGSVTRPSVEFDASLLTGLDERSPGSGWQSSPPRL